MRMEHQSRNAPIPVELCSRNESKRLKDSLGQRKPSSTDNATSQNVSGRLETSKISSTFSSHRLPFTILSQPSSPTKCHRRCLFQFQSPPPPENIVTREPSKDAHRAMKPPVRSASAQSSPRRKLLRQSALENSKESLTGDEKQLIHSTSSSFKQRVIGRELVKTLNRESQMQSDFVGQPKHVNIRTERHNNNPLRDHINNDDNNNCGSRSTCSGSVYCNGTKGGGGGGGGGTFSRSDYRRDETKHHHHKINKYNEEVERKGHLISFRPNNDHSKESLSSRTGKMRATTNQSICRGVPSETNDVSCQSPSPPLTPKTLSANTQQDNKKAAIPSRYSSNSVELKCVNGSLLRTDITKSIDTNQDQSTTHLPSSSPHSSTLIQHQPHKSIGRESTLITISRHGQGQSRDKIQLDQRNHQRSLIKKLRTSGTSVVVNSRNKHTMSNSGNVVGSAETSENVSYGKSPGITGTPTSSSMKASGYPGGSGIVRRLLNKIESKSESQSLTNGKMNGFGKHNGSELKSPVVQFLQPLPRSLEVLEGSEIVLTAKVTGASKVIWVKNDKIVPHSPPDFEYKSNSADGTYSLKIQDCFIEDSGIYICEAYGNDSDLACWCSVKVIEELEDDTSVELAEILEEQEISQTQKNHRFVVPVIITSNASPEPPEVMEPSTTTSALEKRLGFQACRETSCESSREVYEDARDTFEEEIEATPTETLRQAPFLPNDSALSENGMGYSETNGIEQCEIQSPTTATFNEESAYHHLSTSPGSGESDTLNKNDSFDEPFSIDEVAADTIEKIIEITENGVEESHQRVLVEDTHEVKIYESAESHQDLEVQVPDTSHSVDAAATTSPLSPPIKEVRVSISTEEENSPDTRSSCARSYSSQSSRESYGVGGGSDTFRSSFEETIPSPIEDIKSVGSVGSSFRDSFSSTADPRILMGPGNLIVMLGETVNLRVKIQTSDVPGTTVSWCKFVCGKYRRLGTTKPDSSSEELTSESSPHIQICKTNGDTSDLITLRITDANYEDSGKYRVKAQNQLGVDYHQCILSVEGPPEPPAATPNVSYEEKSHSVLVSWSSCPYDGGSAVTGYVLEALIHPANGPSQGVSWVTLTPSSFQRLCYALKNPRSGFSYQFRVSVENAYGKGKTSGHSEPVVVPEFSGVPVASNKDSLEDIMRKMSLSKDLSDDEIAYEYKDVRLKHESFQEYYNKFEQLGKGRFGVVFKVINKSSQKPYAGKFVKCIKGKDKERAQLEYQIMNELKFHPKLICLVDAFQMPREIVIVTEMINGGELFERVVADDFNLTEHDCIVFLRQICDGVSYIHEKNIMHLDLKPENILCTTKTSNKIKIIDFGLAQHYNPKEPISVLFGTAEFVSPEIINYDTICPATDMWSVGVITYILLSGLSPFLGDNDNETFSNITRGEFDFEDEAFDKISEDAKEFISSLILKRKEDRLTAKECLSHKWLALSDEEKRDIVLPTDKLKRFLLRRKWQKTGHAIRAIGRITTLYSSRRSSGGSSSTSSSSPMGLSMHRSLSIQDSIEDSVFESVDIPDPKPHPPTTTSTLDTLTSPPSCITPNNKPKYNDSSRSDSGICDVAPSFTPPS